MIFREGGCSLHPPHSDVILTSTLGTDGPRRRFAKIDVVPSKNRSHEDKDTKIENFRRKDLSV